MWSGSYRSYGADRTVVICYTRAAAHGSRPTHRSTRMETLLCGNRLPRAIAGMDNILELAQLRLNQSMSSMLRGQPLTVDSLCQAALRRSGKDIITGRRVSRVLPS